MQIRQRAERALVLRRVMRAQIVKREALRDNLGTWPSLPTRGGNRAVGGDGSQ